MVYKLGGCRFKSSCSHLNFRYPACFEEGVPWYSGAPKYCRFSLKYVADMIKTNGWNWFNGAKIFYFGFQKHFRVYLPPLSLPPPKKNICAHKNKYTWNLLPSPHTSYSNFPTASDFRCLPHQKNDFDCNFIKIPSKIHTF